MAEIQNNVELVASCGLYCGACKAYLKGRCAGCKENVKAGWCKIRKCMKENNYRTCADCQTHDDPEKCKKFNTFISKIFKYLFRSDRQACINRIKEIGCEKFAQEMAEKNQMTIKR